MGGSVSAGVDNNDLVDNLLSEDCIKTPCVERVFRAVDRGMYFTPLGRESAYKDLAWKSGNIHLSAPCIYCEVMENLNLGPGMSFLNLGSGTGYLSTMAGLILGPTGINHGIEIHDDVIQYARDRLEEFKKTATAIEELEFCEPKFVQGNCLQLDSHTMKYDRVYCGAACPPSYENYMKNLIKVGGILVIPLKDRLLRIRRVSKKVWDTRSVLPVAFANLVEPTTSSVVILPTVDPISLMDTCRTVIRGLLKAAVDAENPELKAQTQPKNKSKKRTLQHLFIPMFRDGESERLTVMTNRPHRNRGAEGDSDNSANSSRGELSNSDLDAFGRPSGDDAAVSPPTSDNMLITPERFRLQEDAASSDADSDAPSDSSSSSSLTNIYQVQRALFHAMTSMRTLNGTSSDPLQVSVPPAVFPPISTSRSAEPNSEVGSSDSSALHDDSSDTSMDVHHPNQDESKPESSKAKGKRPEASASKRSRPKRKEADMENDYLVQSSDHGQNSSELINSISVESSESRSNNKRSGAKREKVDSGMGEDIGTLGNWDMSPSDLGSELDLGSDSDSEEEGVHMYKSDSGTEGVRRVRNGNGKVWKERKGESRHCEANAYMICMRSKIQQLPLPYSIKSYLNFHRDL